MYPTPLVCQEDATFNINAGHVEGQHSNYDEMAHVHNGGSFYGSVDGSVTFVNEPTFTDPTVWWNAGAAVLVQPGGQRHLDGGSPAILLGSYNGYNAWAALLS